MASKPPILLQRSPEGLVTLTINRPAVRNALDWEAMEAFAEAVTGLSRDLRQDEAVDRVVLVTGAGTEAFCSGGDQRALVGDTGRGAGARLARVMGDALETLEQLPVPVIAAVNGYALGGGAETALACDMRIVDRNVRFGLVHLRLGLIPGWGGGQRLVGLVGRSRAARMLLEARTLGVEELQEAGLVDGVADAGRALEAARSLAANIAAADSGAVRAVKSLLLASRRLPFDAAVDVERELFIERWPSPAHLEAMAAFGSDRTPG